MAASRGGAVAVSLLVGLALGSLFAGSALGAQARVFTGSFGGASSTKPNPYPLSEIPNEACVEDENKPACGPQVAVDTSTGRPSSGDIYVTDPNNRRVEKFGPDGTFILMFGKDVNKTKGEEAGSTEAERDVCTASSGDACQAGAKGTGPGAFVGLTLNVAVDSSSGPSAGDVYVANTTKLPNEREKGAGAGRSTIAKFDEDGHLISSWGVGGQLSSSGPPFGASNGITVDPSGNLWVYGTREVEEFRSGQTEYLPHPLVFEFGQDGSLANSWQPSERLEQLTVTSGTGIAVDEGHHVYLNADTGPVLFQFEQSDGSVLKKLAREGAYPAFDFSARQLDARASSGSSGSILSWESTCPEVGFTCQPVGAFTVSRKHSWGSLAIDWAAASDPIYLVEDAREVVAEAIETIPDVKTAKASPVSPTTATLNGTVNPDGVAIAECYFEWGESGKPYENTSQCEAPGAGEGVHARIALQPGKSYHFRLVAANAADVHEPVQGADVTLGPPRVDGVSVTEATATSVTFAAEINPQNLDTRYRFEYLTETEFAENGERFSGPHPAVSVPLTDADLGSGQEEVSVSRHVAGLSLHTAYRYRVVAQNVLGEGSEAVISPIEAFSTWNTGEFGLPDGRQWEMVSPPDKRGALVEPIGEDWLIQAAAGGGRLAYVARTPTESDPVSSPIYQSVLATRGAAGGWSSRDLGVPHIAPFEISVGEGWEYRFFSEDLSQAVVQPFGPFVACKSEQGVAQPCLSPNATEQTPFLAADYAEGGSTAPCTSSCYTPLVTGAEGYANVPAETVFGERGWFGHTCPTELYCGPRFLDATPDARHALLESLTPLTASPSAKANIPPNGLYEWSGERSPDEQIRLVSVLPGSATGEALPATEPELGFKNKVVRNVISDDGARVVFQAVLVRTEHQQVVSEPHLYLRENATQPQSPLGEHGECLVGTDACTVQLDAGLSGAPVFQTANRAVTRILFTDNGDIYEYNVERATRVRLTEGARVLETVIGAGEDGSWLYFVALGALAPGAVPGGDNLYAMHYHGNAWAAPRLVAVLASLDVNDWTSTGTLSELAARVSPNGEWLAFTSTRSLTGYDNRDRASHEPDDEVYEFNASSGRLTCASCNPTGSRPHGVPAAQINSGSGGLTGGHALEWPAWVAATLPPWTSAIKANTAIYQSRYLSDSGRLFFNSSDALVPKDVNNTMDVYEYEPEGVPAGEHSCSRSSESGSVTFKPARRVQVEGSTVEEAAGCVGLISSGESANESAFLDATDSGSEVFFLTSSKLLPQDSDTSYDVYDARECTTASPCLSAPIPQPGPCDNEASCRPAPTPQPDIFGPSGSATFSGPGNLLAPLLATPTAPKPLTKAQRLALALRACRKQRNEKKRATCERLARKKYGPPAKRKKAGARRGHGR